MPRSETPTVEALKGAVPASSTAQQSDNIAHALAGAGGGLLSMTLTYASLLQVSRVTLADKSSPLAIHSSPYQLERKLNPNVPIRRRLMPPGASSSVKASPAFTQDLILLFSALPLRTSCITTVSYNRWLLPVQGDQ